MAATDGKESSLPTKTSKQLLYAEKFAGTLLEQKLHIVGKKEGLTKPNISPPSSVLSRVKNLLPKLAAANEKLKEQEPSELDIEAVDSDYDGPVIEMNLAFIPRDESDEDSSSSEEDNSEDEKDSCEGDNIEGASKSLGVIIPPGNQQKGIKRKLIAEVDEEDEDT